MPRAVGGLFADGRAHSSGMLGGWWQGWSQACRVLLVACSQLGVLTLGGCWAAGGRGGVRHAACCWWPVRSWACSLLGDAGRLVAGAESGMPRAVGGLFAVGRAHSSGMLGGWWQAWSQAGLVLLVVRSQLGVLTLGGCWAAGGRRGVRHASWWWPVRSWACSLLGDVGRAHFSGITIDGMRQR